MIRVLGVLCTPDLELEKQVTSVSAKCFFQLRQLRRMRRSLDRDSAATLVHAFVTSRIDYGNALLAHRQSTSIAVFKRPLKTFLLQQISHLAH